MRLHIRVFGIVQGVFFRANARDVAARLGLTGYVRNMPDGSVEAVAEGPKDRLDEFLEFCKKGPAGAVVEKADSEFSEQKNEFRDFRVRY